MDLMLINRTVIAPILKKSNKRHNFNIFLRVQKRKWLSSCYLDFIYIIQGWGKWVMVNPPEPVKNDKETSKHSSRMRTDCSDRVANKDKQWPSRH